MSIKIEISGSSPLEALATLASAGNYCMNIPAVADAAKNILASESAAVKPGPHSGAPAPAPVTTPGAAPAPNPAPVQGKNLPPAGVAPGASPAPVLTSAAAAPPAGMFSPVQQNQNQNQNKNQAPYSASFGAPVNPLQGAGPNPMTASPSNPNQQQVLPGMEPVTPAPGPGAGPLPISTAPTFTLAQVSKAGADFVTANPNNRTHMTGLFQQFGVQSIAELKPEQVGPFALALQRLGAKF